MVRNYHTDEGFITIPEADELVVRMLKIQNQEEKSHYNKLLKGAKNGEFGAKRYGKRMYQVRRDEIIHYAEEQLRQSRLEQGFGFDFNVDLNTLEDANHFIHIDRKTAIKLQYYLNYLRVHQIISEDIYQKAENKIVLSMNMMKVVNR